MEPTKKQEEDKEFIEKWNFRKDILDTVLFLLDRCDTVDKAKIAVENLKVNAQQIWDSESKHSHP
jgi:hypothetical protein